MPRLCEKSDCVAARDELAEHHRVFKMEREQMTEVTKLWQDAHNNHQVEPPLGELLEWMMGEMKLETFKART